MTVDWCGPDAASFAVNRWHYSQRMPRFKVVRIGVWEHGVFVGAVLCAVLFGDGAAPDLGTPYGVAHTEVCELVRVALDRHETPTTSIVAAAIRLLRTTNVGLRVIVSFADEAQGHRGVIYQAGNWIYTGTSAQVWFRVGGVVVHPKTLHSRYGAGGQSIPWLRTHVDPKAERVARPAKHRYVMPLDRAIRRRVEKMARPYPRPVPSAPSAVTLLHPTGPPDG